MHGKRTSKLKTLTGWSWIQDQWNEGLGPRNMVILMAAGIGMVAGGMAALLKNGIGWLRQLPWIARGTEGAEIRFILPIIGLVLTHLLIRRVFLNRHPGPGIPATLHAISRMRARLSRMSMISPVSATFITVGFGGSAGLEAPTVQSSAAMASEAAEHFNLDYRHRLVLIGCAATASLAAMFKAPLAAIVFAVEVIMIDLTTASLVPLLIASISALLTTTLFIDGNELIQAGRNLPEWDGAVLAYLPFAILCGVASVWFSAVYRGTGQAIRKFKYPGTRIALAGAVVGGVLVAFPSLYGEGFELINDLLRGRFDRLDPAGHSTFIEGTTFRLLAVLSLLWLCKPALTGLTVGAGGVGAGAADVAPRQPWDLSLLAPGLEVGRPRVDVEVRSRYLHAAAVGARGLQLNMGGRAVARRVGAGCVAEESRRGRVAVASTRSDGQVRLRWRHRDRVQSPVELEAGVLAAWH